MKIKTSLQIIVMATIAALVGIICANVWLTTQAAELERQQSLVQDINLDIFQSNQIRDEYFIYRTERQKQQWLALDKKITGQFRLMSAPFDSFENDLEPLIGLHKTIASLFNQLITHDQSHSGGDVANEIRNMIISQMMGESHRLYQQCVTLSDDLSRNTAKRRAYAGVFGILSFGLLGLIIILFSILLIRDVTKPLLKLREGTRIIAGGNFDHRLNIVSSDEIGELAQDFDLMMEQLKTITVSRDELHREMERRMRSEEELRLFKSVFDHSNEACAISDSSGRLVYINNAHEKLFGRSLEEARKFNYRDYYPFDSIEILNQQVVPSLERGESWEGELQVFDAAGRSFPLWERADSIRDAGGKLLFGFGFMHDITDQKREEGQVRHLQKTESLGRMAGAIAHHFNNQLGVVLGNLEMAIDDLPKGAAPVMCLTAAMQAAGKAAEMSSLMLTYLGQTHDKHEPLDLADACRKSLPILGAIIPGKVRLETDLPAPGPVISANADQIRQALINLFTNAWESVREGGECSIRLEVKTVSAADIHALHLFPAAWQSRGNDYACLEVADVGCGIADKDIEKIFDPFFTSKFTGRGMGLPVVLGIVKEHNGAITVESEPGRGSTFRVFFPVSAEHYGDILRQGVPITPSPIMPAEGGGTVLLVDDEEMVRDMAKTMLKRLGYSVLEAKDGGEALDLFRQHRDEIRFVLCDLTMPRLDGWETLTALRKLAPGLPVILASGYDKASVMAGDHPELPQVFLGKPYKLKELGDAISQALVG